MRDATLCVVLTLLVGCGGDRDGEGPIDAPAIDARPVDARPIDARVIDATTDGSIDASTAFDIPSICARVCHRLFAECAGAPEEEAKCRMGCEPDLADCSMAELMTIDECRNVACQPGDPQPVGECIFAVACIDG